MERNTAFVTGLPTRSSVSSVTFPQSGLHAVCARPSLQQRARLPSRRSRVSMALFGLGLPEVFVIAGVGILIFGPNKIAELGKDLGGIAGGVKKASAEFKEAMQDSLDEADREIERKRIEKDSATKKENTPSSTVATIDSTTENKDS